MKRKIIILFAILCPLLASCALDDSTLQIQDSNQSVSTINISFVDNVFPASVWILADTKDNRHTTVWGTAMIKPGEVGKEYNADIPESEDNKYLFRMIDEDEIYYEADIPELLNGWKLILSVSEDNRDAHLDIYDEKGSLIQECNVFYAAL